MKKKIINLVLIFIGTISVVLGFAGIFIPVLPTTPFLLLAAYLYAKSSPRFLKWLLTNPLFGKYIDDYRSGRGISLLHKIISISMLWLTMLLSILFFVDSLWVRVVLILIAIGVTIHLARVKTRKPDSQPPVEDDTMVNNPSEKDKV